MVTSSCQNGAYKSANYGVVCTKLTPQTVMLVEFHPASNMATSSERRIFLRRLEVVNRVVIFFVYVDTEGNP